MAWVWFVAAALSTVACLYWWDKAKKAERRAEDNFASVKMWMDIAESWQVRYEAMMQELAEAEERATAEPEPEELLLTDERLGPAPRIENRAQMFDFANQAFFYRWLEWDLRHD